MQNQQKKAMQIIQPTSNLNRVVIVGEDSFKLTTLSSFSSLFRFSSLFLFNMLLATSEASRT
jgi:hypothetical protein